MKKTYSILALSFLTFLYFTISTPSYAAGGTSWIGNCQNQNIAPNINCLTSVFANATNAFLVFSGVVSLFLIVWAGIRFITSGGDAKQVGAAQKMLTYAIIGLIIVLSSFSILALV